MPDSTIRWHASGLEALAWRVFDRELVVRSERTGNTHLLTPLAGSVLQALALAPEGATNAELIAHLRADGDHFIEADITAAIESALSEFERLGLAWPEQP